MSQLSTSEKLMLAAIELMAEKGYEATTTREIAAAAGFNEVTLFRHFGSKQNLLEAAFERYHYAAEMTQLFEQQLSWELQKDLLLISQTYHRIMNRNRKLIEIAQKGGSQLPKQVREKAHRHPQQFKKLLTNYFQTMAKQGKVIDTNHEILALSYMWMNYGAFTTKLNNSQPADEILDEFIQESVQLFARGLTP